MEYCKDNGLKNEANVIKTAFENPEKAKLLNNVLLGKKSSENIISLDEAAAYHVYMGLSKESYTANKKFTDDRNAYLFPCYDYVRDQERKCVAEDLKVTEDTATASIKSTADNYLGRLLQIDDVKDSVIWIEEEYGKNVAEYYLEIKGGWDGSTQKMHKVNYICIIFN